MARPELREIIKRAFAQEVSKRSGVPYELEYRFAKPDRQWRSDVAWVAARVALEIDGGTWSYGRHNRASSILADMEKGNGYARRGWLVFHAPWEWLEGGKRDRTTELVGAVVEAIKGRGGMNDE